MDTPNENILTRINKGLETIDRLRQENFNLKKQIAFDKKKQVDLRQAYMDLKTQMRQNEEDLFDRNPDIHELTKEKLNL